MGVFKNLVFITKKHLCWSLFLMNFKSHTQNNLKLHHSFFFDSLNRKTSRIQRTQTLWTLWLHALSTTVARVNWMNDKIPEAVVRRCSVKRRIFAKFT